MPVIKSAIKKLRKDRKREKENDAFREILEKTIKDAKKSTSQKYISEAFSVLDKAVKKNILHKNKAARTKASLAKLLPKKESTASKTSTKAAKPTPKKTTKKAVAK